MNLEDRDAVARAFTTDIEYLAAKFRMEDIVGCEHDDLVSIGYMAVLESLDRFDSSRGVTFRTYANRRILGAMQDEVRRWDFFSRRTRKCLKMIYAEQRRAWVEEGAVLSSLNAAEQIGISKRSRQELDRRFFSFCSIDEELRTVTDESTGHTRHEVISDETAMSPEHYARAKEFYRHYAETRKRLPVTTKELAVLVYEEGLTLKRAGEVLGITESAMCRRAGTAVKLFRREMEGWV